MGAALRSDRVVGAPSGETANAAPVHNIPQHSKAVKEAENPFPLFRPSDRRRKRVRMLIWFGTGLAM